MDGALLGAIITSAAALTVAVGGELRRTVQSESERRAERRQEFLVEAQDAVLHLRESLATYGAALQDQVRGGTDPAPQSVVVVPGQPTRPTTSASFVMAVPHAISLQVGAARGRLRVAGSRLEDDEVITAIEQWETLAQASMIDPHDTPRSAEEAAFDAVNALIHAALQRPDRRARWGRRR